jgi:hypothetical protein
MAEDNMKLSEVLSNEKLSSVAMINILNHNDNSYSYNLWKLEKDKLFLFDNEYKISHILFLDWIVEEIEPGSYFVKTNQNYTLKLDLYFGGSIGQ